MTAHFNPKYLLFHDVNNAVVKVRSDDAQSREYCTFYYPLDLPFSSWYAQSNGLICVSTMFDKNFEYNPDIYIWNPIVQKIKTVPESPLTTFEYKEIEWSALAFGFLPEVDDYGVVHTVKPSVSCAPYDFGPYDEDYEQYLHTVVIGVYSLNTNSWKKICQDKVFVDRMSTDQSVFVNGTAFWVGRKIENPIILPFGQSIAYFVEVDQEDADEDDDEYDGPHLDIWVLKDDKVGGFSWKKKMSVGLSENVLAEVLGIRNKGEPILAKSNNLISYDLETHEPYDFVELTTYSYREEGSRSPYVISPFVETLVLLDIDCNN
ncbi:F-box domain-containing protein [Heracleum sosnowskyi]|uniref:F-box domain-containing protein n=1 Tax=Heracleum sosnowskyi TaxID=360622 RepID=A0AAD8MH49_9APIA|nr:F-box domain-containing protein [Heracleum sosnowskyi]